NRVERSKCAADARRRSRHRSRLRDRRRATGAASVPSKGPGPSNPSVHNPCPRHIAERLCAALRGVSRRTTVPGGHIGGGHDPYHGHLELEATLKPAVHTRVRSWRLPYRLQLSLPTSIP